MQADRLIAAAAGIVDQLCRDAIWYQDRTLWLGDERREVAGSVEVVHTTIDGSLYGGTAGIGLVLTRAWNLLGDDSYRRTAQGALAHAASWLDHQRPEPSLLSGGLGVIVAMAEAGLAFCDERLLADATVRAESIADALPPRSFDVVGGLAGSVIAWLRLATLLDNEQFVEVGRDYGKRLLVITDECSVGAGWRDDSSDEPALCGLAHGASGVAWALADLWRITGDAEFLATSRAATTYERAWYRRDEMNWPDLREVTRAGEQPQRLDPSPVYWCHGALGIGLVRLRLTELTRSTSAAAEAGAALVAAEREVARMREGLVVPDLSLCHGLCGAVELLFEGSRVFEQPVLAQRANEAAQLVVDLGQTVNGWPCGVTGGGENPSLMLGLAGIAGVLLRVAAVGQPPLGLLYSLPVATTRLIVKLSGQIDQEHLQARLDELTAVLPGGTVERVSRSGRAVVRLAPGASIEEAVAAAQRLSGVEYAEADVIDRATDG